jgi:uncharacterized protein (DUF2141 family)
MRTLVLSAAAMAAALAAAGAAFAGDVTVKLNGVQARHGVIYVALQSGDQFLKHGSTAGAAVPDPAAGAQTVVLHNVPPGDYAVVVIHDENGDKMMNFDAGGMPLEGWAMTRYGPGQDHSPTFEEARVTVSADGAAYELTMNYPK